MSSDSTLALALLVGFAFAAAGVVKGVIGFGLPTVAMGLLSLAMAPAEAAMLLVVPSLVTNLWQLLAGPRLAAISRRLATMMLGVVVGTLLGIGVLTGSSSVLAAGALGAVLAVYGAFGLSARRFTVRPSAEPRLAPVIGLLTGLVTGATGIFAIPAVPYLNSLDLSKDELIQALGLAFTVSTLALAAGLALSGSFRWSAATASLLAVVPAVAGMAAGQFLRSRLRPEAFRRGFFIGLVMLGLYMVARTLLHGPGSGAG